MSISGEQIRQTEYAELMRKSYIDYAMSVIIARALPDVRDGLKPVQRRTLYDMYELGVRHDRPYRKCARIVGDTMGKYHPHGDSSIYGALVVMAQDFKYGLPLVDGHGNFGSVEGDGAAAMRYTEARLAKVAEKACLSDLDRDVVDFIPNFDACGREPAVLPARIPNILVNGAEGIAVGMATSIPPHNLGEVLDGVIAYMKNPDITEAEMLELIPGPDFPTGGIVTNKDELAKIYESGSGRIRIRGKVDIERAKGGRERIVISEIPYTMVGANIGKFLNDVYSLAESKKTTDITDISNQSSREGIRIVIDLKKGADAQNICNLLYRKTRLEDTFGVNMLAVADGRPETMGLFDIIRHNVRFQYELADRKYNALLAKEREKSEAQEGLIRACDVIDLIIEILRGSKDVAQAKACLADGVTDGIHFSSALSKAAAASLRFTERQAKAILEMRLQKLIGMEVDTLKKEHEETLGNIAFYEKVLGSRAAMVKVLVRELEELKKEFAVPRKTVIENTGEAVYAEREPEAVPLAVLTDRFGYVRAVDLSVYEKNREAADAESSEVIFCMSDDSLCLFTDTGQMHLVKVADVPLGKFRDKGIPVDNICNYSSDSERMVKILCLSDIRGREVLFATKSAMVKRVSGTEFDVAKRRVAATKLEEGDRLLCVDIAGDQDTFVMQSDKNYFLRIAVSDVPEQKKAARGARGMRLAAGESLAAAWVLGGKVNAEGREGRLGGKVNAASGGREGRLGGKENISADVRGRKVALNRLRIGKRGARGVRR